ncbi:MAG: 4-(cytidine 5'-diphospho)-2-C-methyl-D-erythritol kinase [Acidothermus sp.]|nr:4-(cytidine 5'-diphospho)-2-C-methyl-D-erythritol kinase [Acidothermus sp.]MCL6537733.1 4-(cytidine 5'-diphospho)-2-C-methyl-D-erythritol kinase [Acidothermus sp.]
MSISLCLSSCFVSVTVRAPAKVNLFLGVGPRRPDGYHELATVFQAVSLYDELRVRRADELRVDVRGDDSSGVPCGEDNLAVRAVRAIAHRLGYPPEIHLDLLKGIPVAGGMAGGSADAAAALVACNALWEARLSTEVLLDIAAGIGSDVPFCLLGGTALGYGRGERLAPILTGGTFHWVIALADVGLSTAAVYAEFDKRYPHRAQTPHIPPELLSALRDGDAARLGPLLHNDLQEIALALRPSLARTLEAGLELGALGAIVCGSGPSCAFLVGGADGAIELAARLAGTGLVKAVRRCAGPVPGARVLGTNDGS